MALETYRAKRHFGTTPEPAGKVGPRKAKQLSFVVQKHAATRLHYDFRLELDGVLKSWAVPKGPSLDPHEKRLAMEVEDHPLDYASFEGTIPKGEYGGGEVIVWDRGTWLPLKDPHRGLSTGKLELELHGEKLNGVWNLVRLRKRSAKDKPAWLLIKRTDEHVRPLSEYDITEDLPASVKTGRTLEDIRAGVKPKRANMTKKAAPKKTAATTARAKAKPRAKSSRAKAVSSKKGARKGAKSELPGTVEPQLAVLERETPKGPQWLHEMKLDGYRIIARLEDGKVRLITRSEQDWTHRYTAVADALRKLPVENAILDGELVALLPSGVSSFQALQNAQKEGEQSRLVYYAFDLLFLDGEDLRALPLMERKSRLADLLSKNSNSHLQLSEHIENDGPAFFQQACRLGLEGVISKRADRPYRSGRSEEWIKTKCVGREEIVIGGFTLSTAVARGIGALLVGYFEKGKFHYAGRVGTGFSTETLLDLRQRLEKIRQDQSPFVAVPSKERRPDVRWVRPEMVAQVEFTGWTDAGILRHPSFQGLREDKPATSVTRPASLIVPPESAPPEGDEAMAKKKGKTSKSKKRSTTSASPPVELSHPDRVLDSETGLTKLGLATYYHEVADWILPHLKDRPLSLVRCPDGQGKKCFFQKHAVAGVPEALERVDVEEKEDTQPYVMANSIEGLVSLAQMSIMEIHPWGSRADRLDHPDLLIMDLDPGEGVSWTKVIDAAHQMRELLKKQGLESYLKTTGGKGLHVVVPLAPRRADWDQAKAFCRSLAEEMAAADPKNFIATMSKAARRGKIFVDYLRNDRGATAVAPYSTRAKPGVPVSTPIGWDELSPNLKSDHFRVDNVLTRLGPLRRDPWKDFFDVKQTLPKRAR